MASFFISSIVVVVVIICTSIIMSITPLFFSHLCFHSLGFLNCLVVLDVLYVREFLSNCCKRTCPAFSFGSFFFLPPIFLPSY
jgi:hypothetical protein